MDGNASEWSSNLVEVWSIRSVMSNKHYIATKNREQSPHLNHLFLGNNGLGKRILLVHDNIYYT